MIIKLSPDQVTEHWDVIKFGIQESVPPITYGSQNTLNNMLKSLLTGEMQCWVMMNGTQKIQGVATTTITKDGCSGVKNLMIYSVYGLTFIDDETWAENLKGLRKFAKANSCHRIISFTAVDRLIDLTKSLGGSADFTFVSLEV